MAITFPYYAVDGIRAQNPRAEIILQTMNPAWDSPSGSNSSATLRPNLPAYYQTVRDVTAERGLLVIDHHPNWLAFQASDLATFQTDVPDGVHPIAAGTQTLPAPGWQSAAELRLYYSKGGSGLFYQSLPVAPGDSAKFLRLRITQP